MAELTRALLEQRDPQDDDDDALCVQLRQQGGSLLMQVKTW
jgi:hypothetical protein